jgi:ATP-dependent Lon protease
MEGYTRESGVRGLEAKLRKQIRRNAAKSSVEEEYKVTDEEDIIVLGVPRCYTQYVAEL